MGAFNKAAAAAKIPASTTKSDDIVVTPEDEAVRKAVDAFEDAKKRAKQAKGDITTTKGVVEPFARDVWLKEFANTGKYPETFWVQGTKTKVQHIVQDRSGVNDVTDESLALLKTLLGEQRAESIIEESTVYAINNAILNMPGVMEHLDAAIQDLETKGILTVAQRDALLEATPRRVVKEGSLQLLARLCDNDPERMAMVADALGSNMTTYIK